MILNLFIIKHPKEFLAACCYARMKQSRMIQSKWKQGINTMITMQHGQNFVTHNRTHRIGL
jgi:hypothetical protein